ncbi:hypothetical protein EJ03DRAFT_194373 [Teratosphaeria nubilosa]|uniref:Uncharacterized protein n=1 Tax=Teratosphaeria nubilosa TaxID=161662 RepID=A0A6G1KYY2_9PEZI|nr:hypothetical protein EJ03DRAFT_194373 [Teratosphaeria nubilosa]
MAGGIPHIVIISRALKGNVYPYPLGLSNPLACRISVKHRLVAGQRLLDFVRRIHLSFLALFYPLIIAGSLLCHSE